MLSKNIDGLINKLSEESGYKYEKVYDDVVNEETSLYTERFYNANSRMKLQDSFFFSAIGRVRNQYKKLYYLYK